MAQAQCAALVRQEQSWRAPAHSVCDVPPNSSVTGVTTGAARLRSRAAAAELILLHRLRARAAGASGSLDHAGRIIGLTARAWLR